MLPSDYTERVYAGVLGKVIGVYLGRPFEGWRYDRIRAELGDITYYVNDRADTALKHHLLVVTDDDISGTFVFPRALRDAGLDPAPADVGAAWLNYIVEDRCVLWWGGLGNSTEHTAYLRMKAGLTPPDSGAMAVNGQVVAEQVGAQIFVEGFAMTCPGDPKGAADLAERAARVSHDGESIHAARVVAALVAGAFTATDMGELLDDAVALIPAGSLIRRVIDDVRGWAEGGDWTDTRARIEERYGYHRYGGNCHVVPNHAVVIAALAHSGGAFDSAMTVVNTSGWDTDSNSGNVGAICGVFGGLAGLSTKDWRGPLRDRMYLPTADGGAVVTDAAREALALARLGHARHGLDLAEPAARFHFTLPGSVQGFASAKSYATGLSGNVTGTPLDRVEDVAVSNAGGRLRIDGAGTVVTPTFIPPEARDMPIYGLLASPTLYSGQTLRASVSGARARLVVMHYDGDDQLVTLAGPPGVPEWTVPDTGGQPIAFVGVQVDGPADLHHLTWDGSPEVTLTRPADGGGMWRRALVPAVDRFDERWPEPFRIVQNRGTGMLVSGSREWRDYLVTADVTPHLAAACGLAARVQGLRRYYALELAGRDRARLVRGTGEVLAECGYAWEFGRTYTLALRVDGSHLVALVDGATVLEADDDALDCGGVALVVTEGRSATTRIHISPTTNPNSVAP